MSDKEIEGWKVGDLVLNLLDLTVGEVVDTDSDHADTVCPLDGIKYPVQVRRLTRVPGQTMSAYFYISHGRHRAVLRISRYE